MKEATWREGRGRDARMLVVDGQRMASLHVADVASELRAGDLVVLNDAATLPALLRGTTERGEEVEVRLAAHGGDGSFRAVLFGAGDTSMRTEDRGPAPRVRAGETLRLTSEWESSKSESSSEPESKSSSEPVVEVVEVDAARPRLVTLRFSGDAEAAIFRVGRPVQYAYVSRPLSLFHVTPAFAAEPWAFEPASAGLTLDFATLARIRAKGAEIALITHAAGLSSLGDPSLDALLPFPELSRVPEETVDAVRRTKARGGRVFAIGTTVVRALESAAVMGPRLLDARFGLTSLVLDEARELRVVDAVLTGVHVPGESHNELLTAFQPRSVLGDACERAEREGYRSHELGDTMLVFAHAAMQAARAVA